ncbi:AsmA-like C-terminal region-containing protein [Fulvivirgaceae bacterium BMA10]|uniref:AsmA-like C-terminal region-containing protein n=1 Tax=Splendidivirga corallicola TaxID=3051826 RepID=A0ABT8KMY8_9BACT|nr:AsmA-like C-terminal region-containing protein [Fulvivirgaceae bacterium BMA10]
MKKFLMIVLAIIIVIVAAAFVIPIIFKDEIKASIDSELAKSVNAHVYFDVDKFGLSMFKNFPNITASMRDFGVIGKDEFEGEVLLAVHNLEVEVNLKSVLFDDQMRLKGITLEQPIINILVLENGKANYDIAISSGETETVEEDTTAASDFSFGIDKWEILNGQVVYDDRSMPFYLELSGMNHVGGGDFSLDIFDLTTSTQVEKTTVTYDGIEYISNKQVDLDAILNMDMSEMKFTFKDNTAKVNDFTLQFDGFFAMPTDDYQMDISFASKKNDFKSILSLVPGVFTEGFESIKTNGELQFSGFVKGTYNETTMPTFNLALKVDNAMFQYPDLPTAISNINMDLLVDNKDGVIDNTLVDLKKFHMEFGSNPIDARLTLRGLTNYNIDTDIAAKLNLGELASMFPMEGLEMKGTYGLNLNAKGTYDSIKQIIPKIDASMTLSDGYIKYAEYPIPMENINVSSTIKNESGKMAETYIDVDNFNLLVDGEKVEGSLALENLDNYTWDAKVNGTVDLEKISKILQLDDMTLKGKISANMTSKGKMSDVEAERYGNIPTSGTTSIKDFYFESADLPQGFGIATADASFNPQRIEISRFDGKAGKSDIKVNGYVNNYLNYLFKPNELLKGKMDFSSSKFDVNEWMVAEEGTSEDTETSESDTTSSELEVVEIPKNIDFELNSRIAQVLYDNMTLNDLHGNIIVRNGEVRMDKVNFNTLGGSFVMNGSYNTHDPDHPKFDFDLDMKNVSIKQSYATFNTVQAFAPIAQIVNGSFSTKFKIDGELGQDMMPVLSSISGAGLINIIQAALEGNSQIVSGITSLAKLDNSKTIALKNLLLSTEIKDGKLSVDPFDIKLNDLNTNVTGNIGLDGSLDYNLEIELPANIANQLTSSLGSVVSLPEGSNTFKKLPIHLGGTYLKPEPKLGQIISKDEVKEQVTDAVKEKGLELLTNNKDKIIKDSVVASYVDSARIQKEKEALQAKKDSIAKAAKAKLEAEKKAAEDSIKKAIAAEKQKGLDKIKGLFKKKDN